MFLKVGNSYIDIWKISAYKIEKEGSNYFITFFVEGNPFKLEKAFSSENEAFRWLENLEQTYPDIYLTEVIDYDKSKKHTQVKKLKSKVIEHIEKVIAITVLIFFVVSFVVGVVITTRFLLENLYKLFS